MQYFTRITILKIVSRYRPEISTFEKARPFSFCRGHFYGKLLKGHQGQDQGQQRPWPPCNSRAEDKAICSLKKYMVGVPVCYLCAVFSGCLHHLFLIECTVKSKRKIQATYLNLPVL